MKSKRGGAHGDPVEMVTAEKQRRIRRASEAWLGEHPEHGGLEVRFDVVALRGRAVDRVSRAIL